VPPATNDIDYTTLSDVRLVLYFTCLHSADLEATIRANAPKSGEAAQSFSARLHAPDEFFAFGPPPDGSRTIRFALDARAFPFNQRNLQSTQIGVQVLRASETGMAQPFPGVALTLRMAGKSGAGTTDSQGSLATTGAGGPLASLVHQPLGNVEIEFTGPPEQIAQVADVFLLLNYGFDYR
jgi:hypothetical protein